MSIDPQKLHRDMKAFLRARYPNGFNSEEASEIVTCLAVIVGEILCHAENSQDVIDGFTEIVLGISSGEIPPPPSNDSPGLH